MKPINYQRAEQEAPIIADRPAAWRQLTPQQQLAELDARLGPGLGAVKQRKQIQGRL